MMEMLQEKMKKVDEDTLTRFLKLTIDRITKEELTLLTSRMLEFTRMITIYLFDVKNREESFDYTWYHKWWRPVGKHSSGLR